MPTYRFYNSKTKTEFEDYMSISDMEKFTKKKHIELLPPTQMISVNIGDLKHPQKHMYLLQEYCFYITLIEI